MTDDDDLIAELREHFGPDGTGCFVDGDDVIALLRAIDAETKRADEAEARGEKAKRGAERMRERAANVCERMVVGGRAWTDEQRVAAGALFAAADAIRALDNTKDDDADGRLMTTGPKVDSFRRPRFAMQTSVR